MNDTELDELLDWDFHVSTKSPVVRGTWITVDQIISLIVDGFSWSDILRGHPELTEKDLRACIGYKVNLDN